MTERELDRTKSELVRALRRRAAEMDAAEQTITRPFGLAGAPLARSNSTLTPMRPTDERRSRRAFFARDTFRDVVLNTTLTGGTVAAGRSVA